MRSPAKPCRAQVELTDDEDDAFDVAIERNQERADVRLTRQSVLRQLVSGYCKSAGVRFPAPSRRKKRAIRSGTSESSPIPTQTSPR